MADLEQSAEQLFSEALDLPPEHRSAFLDQACRGVPELRRLVDGPLSSWTADCEPLSCGSLYRSWRYGRGL